MPPVQGEVVVRVGNGAQWARNAEVEDIFILNKFVVICRFLSETKLNLNILF